MTGQGGLRKRRMRMDFTRLIWWRRFSLKLTCADLLSRSLLFAFRVFDRGGPEGA